MSHLKVLNERVIRFAFQKEHGNSGRETFGAGWGPNPKVGECDAEDTPRKDRQRTSRSQDLLM